MSYTPTRWENGKAPAINADNLNKIENELVNLDTFVEELKEDSNDFINDVAFDSKSGVVTFTTYEGTEKEVDVSEYVKRETSIKNVATGENIHIADSKDDNVIELDVYGKSEQKQYTGKNQLPYPFYDKGTFTRNGVTFTDNGDGSVTANGTATATTSFIFNHRIDSSLILGADTYIASGCPSGGSNTTYRMVVARTSETTGSFEVIVREYGNGAEFTLENDTDLYVGAEIPNGATVSNVIFRPMIRLASITDATWEPYVGGIPSPNPEYPQEVISSVVSEVKSHGKNFIPYPYFETTKTQSGITFTDLGDGRIEVSGTSTNVVSLELLSEPIKLDVNKKYTITGSPQGSAGSTNYAILAKGLKPDGSISNLWVGEDGLTFSGYEEITNQDGLLFRIRIAKGVTVNNLIFEPMLRLAEDLDDTFEPYKESVVTLSQPIELNRIEVTANDDYTYEKDGKYYIADTIEKIDGEYKKVQRISEKVFDGVNNLCSWVGSVTANSEKLWQINLDNKAIGDGVFIRSNAILSNKFKAIAWTVASDSVAYGCRQGSNKAICCYLNESDGVTDVASANTWLQANPTTVYYILAEPIITSLPSEVAELDNLLTFYPVTNVSNNANAEMKLKYYADTKNYIDGKIATLEMALVNSI